ncbi:transporter substrate-binding domain-containing protein [Evansella tamaricis]|uniref:Transporter substrate-binding domain-containing protein n=1 Tax=Evansella tamaricis TaxID=2069301 RepID=A0ABS6JBC7_9BACI|nr:transporter substrate-binding domain-containing protein [Evansella tamaricis]MBU9710976.1 transporter substrate-binding domain-containing protein [Evansella tamaricis]
MNRLFKTFLPILLLMVLLLAACGDDDAGGDGITLEEGKFVFALSGEYRPFSYINEDGELVGFDVDIGMAIAEEMGLEGEPYQITWNSIIPGLQDNRYDAIIGSMGITEERMETVDFSDPYYFSGAQLYVRGDSGIGSINDVDDSTEVAVAEGTTYHTMIQDHTTNIATYDSDVVALQALAQGRHDAVVTDRLVGLINIEEQGFDIEMVGELIDTERIAIAIRQNEEDLLAAINDALATIRESGVYEEINARYFDENIGEE